MKGNRNHTIGKRLGHANLFYFRYMLLLTDFTSHGLDLELNDQWTFYSATSFLEKCRKVVLEKWFFKLGFFFLVNHFSPT